MFNKAGLRPVQRPVELVHYFGGWVEDPSKQTDSYKTCVLQVKIKNTWFIDFTLFSFTAHKCKVLTVNVYIIGLCNLFSRGKYYTSLILVRGTTSCIKSCCHPPCYTPALQKCLGSRDRKKILSVFGNQDCTQYSKIFQLIKARSY